MKVNLNIKKSVTNTIFCVGTKNISCNKQDMKYVIDMTK